MPQSLFRHRQQLRRWAARVLLLWLFGLGAAVANGCMAGEPQAPVAGRSAVVNDVATVQQAQHALPAAPHAHHHGEHLTPTVDGAPDHHGGAGKTNCQDFCDKAQASIPPLKSALDDVHVHALTLASVTLVLPAPAFATIQTWVPRRDGVRPPTIAIAFGRLAL